MCVEEKKKTFSSQPSITFPFRLSRGDIVSSWGFSRPNLHLDFYFSSSPPHRAYFKADGNWKGFNVEVFRFWEELWAVCSRNWLLGAEWSLRATRSHLTLCDVRFLDSIRDTEVICVLEITAGVMPALREWCGLPDSSIAPGALSLVVLHSPLLDTPIAKDFNVFFGIKNDIRNGTARHMMLQVQSQCKRRPLAHLCKWIVPN